MVVAILKAFGLMLVLGAVLGGVLAFASIKFYVKEDNRKEELTALLPGYNCGACGNPGCAAMAVKCKLNSANQASQTKEKLLKHILLNM